MFGFGPDFLPPSPFLVVQDPQTQSSHILVEPHLIDAEFRKAWMLFFSVGLVILLSLLIRSWIWLVIFCLRSLFWIFLGSRVGICRRLLGLRNLLLVVWMVGAWNEIKALPLPWFSGLAILLELVETSGVWLQGLLDAYIAMIPKGGWRFYSSGSTAPFSVLLVVYRLWASLRLGHLREWVEGWLPKSVYSLGLVLYCFRY